MNSKYDDSPLHSDLSALENLSKFTFDSKMLYSQKYSSRIMNGSEVDIMLAYKENIMPWEIEIFTAYSIIYDQDNVTTEIDAKSFAEIITYIRNYWDAAWNEAERSGRYTEAFMMRTAIQQFPIQGVFLQKLFRFNYFFNFINEKIDMKKMFFSKFGADYVEFEITAFTVFLAFSNETVVKINAQEKQKLLTQAFQNKTVFSMLCIKKVDYVKEINKLYQGDMIRLFYGLKAHYWWPFVSGTDFIYVPSPYLIINAVTDSMLNRLTLDNKRLRNLIGKEIIEQYLYDIYKQVDTVTWISPEIEYKIARQNHRTSDVLVGENECCTFYDTKGMVPSLKIRDLDHNEVEKDTKIYAEAVIQIYHQIKNYLNGYFSLDKKYEKEKLFGVVVMLDDIALSRERIYDKVFELYKEQFVELDIEEQNYIHSHIKIVSLRPLESKILENNSFLPCLLKQEKNPAMWNDLNFSSSYAEKGFIPIYNNYVTNIKNKFADQIKVL